MYSLFIKYLSKLSNYLTNNLNVLTTLSSLKTHNPKFCYPYNLILGSLRVNPSDFKKLHFHPDSHVTNVFVNIIILNLKFFILLTLITKCEEFIEPSFVLNSFFLLFKLRQFIHYLTYNFLYNTSFIKFLIQSPEIYFQTNHCQCKQSLILKSIIISPVFYLVSFLSVEMLKQLITTPLGLCLNAHFIGYWLLENHLANSGICCRCRYSWLNKRNFYCLGLGASYLSIFNITIHSLSFARIKTPLNSLIISNLLWTLFSLLIHLNNNNHSDHEGFYCDIYLIPKKISLNIIQYIKESIAKNLVKSNNSLYEKFNKFYYYPPIFVLINILFIKELRNRKFFIRTPPMQTLLAAYKTEAAHCLNWFSWLQSWYNSRTVRLAKCVVDIKKIFSEYFPKTLVMIIIALMKIQFFNRNRLREWSKITDSAVIDNAAMNILYTYLHLLIKKIPHSNKSLEDNKIHENYFNIKQRRELFLPAFKEEKKSLFNRATSEKELQIIDIRLFDTQNRNDSSTEQETNSPKNNSSSLLNWGYEPGI